MPATNATNLRAHAAQVTVDGSFPSISTRLRVRDIEEQELSPVENATDIIQDQRDKMALLADTLDEIYKWFASFLP